MIHRYLSYSAVK